LLKPTLSFLTGAVVVSAAAVVVSAAAVVVSAAAAVVSAAAAVVVVVAVLQPANDRLKIITAINTMVATSIHFLFIFTSLSFFINRDLLLLFFLLIQ
jgi:hypothetical protein